MTFRCTRPLHLTGAAAVCGTWPPVQRFMKPAEQAPEARCVLAAIVRVEMKKPTIKLALRKETLRTLAKVDLARAVGGNDGLAPQTNRAVCTAQDAVATAAPPG